MVPQQLQLLSNIAANTTGNALFWQGGVALFSALGTFGGGTVTLQVLGPDGATWQALGASTTVTAAGNVTGVYVPAGPVRAVLTGAAGASGIYVTLTAELS